MRKKLIIITVLVLILNLILIRIVSANAYSGLSIAEKMGEYHIRVNEITDNHFKALFLFFQDKSIEEILEQDLVGRFEVPSEDDMAYMCNDGVNTNLSSSCLQYKLNKEYGELIDSLIDEFDNINVTPGADITEVSGANQNEAEFVMEEINSSRELQRATLSFYRQTLIAYPLHTQFEITKEQLDDFLDTLVNIKNIIRTYPSKFHNASTAFCS